MNSIRSVVKALCFSLMVNEATAKCIKPLPAGQEVGMTNSVNIRSGGIDRSYLVTFPVSFDCGKPTPVILSYHGAQQEAAQQLELSQLSNPFFNDFAIVVYPQGIEKTWQGVPDATADDLSFTTDILNQIEEHYWVDTTRIWATGKSDGAGFTNMLACDFSLSRRIAAFAPVSGAYYVKTDSCAPETMVIPCNSGRRKIPMIAFHGERDETVGFAGGEDKGHCLPSIPQFIQNWAMRDSLGLENTTTMPRKDTLVYKFGKGLEKGLITLVYDTSIGHEWPSITPNADNSGVGKRAATFDATRVIIDFFQAHSLVAPSNPLVVQRAVSSGASSIQPSLVPSSIQSSIPPPATGAPSPTRTPIAASDGGRLVGSIGSFGAILLGVVAFLL